MESEEFLVAGPDGRTLADESALQRLVELAGLFEACRLAFYQTADRFHWQPAPGSPADQVASVLPSPDPKLTTSRPETGHRLINGVVHTYLLTAAGHMGALGALHSTSEVLFAPGMLVRGILECCARVMWVLGEGQDAPEQLLARAYLEEFLSAEEAKKAASRMGGKQSDVYIDHAKQWTALRNEIIGRFPGTDKDDLAERDGRVLAGEKLPGPAAGATWMYDLLERHAGSTVGKKAALGIYDYLSNVTHPTLYPTRQLREWVERPDHPDEKVAQLHIDVDFLDRQAVAAVVVYYNAQSYVTSYFGWSREIHDDLSARIDAVLPGTLNDPAAGT